MGGREHAYNPNAKEDSFQFEVSFSGRVWACLEKQNKKGGR